ncbi:MAG: M20/M25/M40 family metallo-hydrolase [Lactobacillaceae bacterium]|nr:M20/M25/M40 family metallo-hydrolase [Lactobacillaceae bacterium]
MTKKEYYLEKLKELIALPSVSATKSYQKQTAEVIKKIFEEINAEVLIDEEFGAPFVLAKIQSSNVNAKNIVIYNHYDVQPEEPVEEWESDPFVLTQKGDKLFGRGVADDKGHFTARLTALEEYREEHNGNLPVNIYWILEGSEESASVGLDQYLEKYKSYFPSNIEVVIWESGELNAQGQSEIVGGNKGIITFTLSFESANNDLHSSYASVVDSATWHLIDAISSLRNSNGEINIDGLYDDANVPNQREKDLIIKYALESPEKIKEDWGLTLPLINEKSKEDFFESLYFKSTLNIEGIISGYTGEGVKTVLPKYAEAKLEIRLVPGQKPNDIFNKLVKQLEKNGYADIKAELTLGEPGYRSDMSAPAIENIIELSNKKYGEVAVFPTSPGTGPMYYVNSVLKAPIAGFGLGYWGSLAHAPNENIRLIDYDKHIEIIKEIISTYE